LRFNQLFAKIRKIASLRVGLTDREELRTILRTKGKEPMTTLDDVADSHTTIQITGKRNSAVLVSQDDWQAIQETLFLTSIPGMRESIQSGLKKPISKCDKELKW
jgi:PHD/YefM family antitoxin component YafN of YafNO toxin-antitoxin module